MTEEIQNYIHKSQRYLQDCQLLHTQGGSPDSVVSRAYYAMFYVAKALLLSIDKDAHTHQGVIAAFGLHFVKTAIFSRELGRSFADMLNKRMTGDYDIDGTISEADAQECYQQALIFTETGINYLEK